jgi:hypothetical protein
LTFISDGSGSPLADVARANLPAPDASVDIVGETSNSAGGTWRLYVRMDLTTVPTGAVGVTTWLYDEDWQRAWPAVTISASAGVWRVGFLGESLTPGTKYYARLAFRDSANAIGDFREFLEITVPERDGQEPDPGDDLEFTENPSLVVTAAGVRSGATLLAEQGAFTGDSDGVAALTLWTTATSTAPTPGATTHGTQVSPWTFGTTTLLAGVEGRYPWVRAAITDGVDTVYAWSSTPGVIAEAPVSTAAIAEAAVTLTTVADIGGGLYQPIFHIDPAVADADDYDGFEEATGTKIRVAFTRRTTSMETALANWMPVVPGDYVGLDAPLTTAVNPAYTGAAGYWRLDERPDQTIEGAGGTYEDGWALKRGRPQDETDPRRVIRLWQVSYDGGTTWTDATTWDKQPDMPAVTPPTEPLTSYWKSIERTTGASTADPNNHGFGGEYTRCQMFCEDEPQYGILGGDMCMVRLSDTMGRTWHHAESTGLRSPGFNSVWIDPRNHNYLLAMGNMVWWSRRGTYTSTAIGIWRSTDFGKTWVLAQQLNNASSDEWNQSLFTYDPATRTNAVGARTIYLVNRLRLTGQDAPTTIELWRSTQGGAPGTWSRVGTNMGMATGAEAVGRYGRCYQLVPGPGSTLLLASQTGLWESNAAKTAWTRVARGCPAIRCSTVQTNAARTKIYAAFRAWGTVSALEGVYYSGDSGASFSEINFGSYQAKRVAVNWSTTPERVFIQLNLGNPAGMVSSRNGAAGPWVAHGLVPASINWMGAGDTYHRQLSKKSAASADGYDGVTCPQFPDVCVVNAVGRMFMTDDGGRTFEDTTRGFTGLNFAATGKPMLDVNPNNSAEWIIPIQDSNAMITLNNGVGFVVRQVKYLDPASGQVTQDGMLAATGASSPGSSYSAAWLRSGRILVGFGDEVQAIVGSDDKGLTWFPLTAMGVSGTNQPIVRHPTSSPEAVAIGNKITKNGGASVAVTFSGTAMGIDSSNALYVMRANGTEIWKSTNWSTAATPTFTAFYQGPSFNKWPYTHYTCARVSRAESNTVWLENGDRGDLVRVRNSGTAFNSAVVTSFPLKNLNGGWSATFFELADIAPDPNDPNLVYVTIYHAGATGMCWRLRISGSSHTFENVTINLPKWHDQSVQVVPHTGDVLVGGSVGGWMLPPPSGYTAAQGTAASRWSQLAQPVKVPVVA